MPTAGCMPNHNHITDANGKCSDDGEFCVEAMLHGYQIFIYNATIGEKLPCQREPDNHQDPFAIAVVISLIIVLG